MPGTTRFFGELEPLDRFIDATTITNHVDLPGDWWVVLSDVKGSTKAIEAGRYKDVNSVGVATVIAVLNVDRSVEIPFVFGGDGATLAIPPELVDGVQAALLGAQQLSRDGFALDLRVGMIPVAHLVEQDRWTRLAKYRLSEHIVLTAISGRGWDVAEELIKDPGTRAMFEVTPTGRIGPDADFTGFECRWKSVPSRNDHKFCLLVKASETSTDAQLDFYREFFRARSEIYGSDHHPLYARELELHVSPAQLMGEARIRAGASAASRVLYASTCAAKTLYANHLFRTGTDIDAISGSRYRDEVVNNSDYQKFDGTLKMVMDGSEAQSERMESFLDDHFRQDRCIYGVFRAPEALITCMVRSYHGEHVHFVDGTAGGYAMAAKEYKRRLKDVLRSRSAASVV